MNKIIALLSILQVVFISASWITGNAIFSLAFFFTLLLLVIYLQFSSKTFGDWITTKEVKLPKWLSWIGGFVTGLIPFVAFVNTNRRNKKRMTSKGVNYHEKMHLEWLYKQGNIFWFFTTIMGSFLIAVVLNLPKIIVPIAIAGFLTNAEIVTNRLIKQRFNQNVEPKKMPRWLYYLQYFGLYLLMAIFILTITGLKLF